MLYPDGDLSKLRKHPKIFKPLRGVSVQLRLRGVSNDTFVYEQLHGNYAMLRLAAGRPGIWELVLECLGLNMEVKSPHTLPCYIDNKFFKTNSIGL